MTAYVLKYSHNIIEHLGLKLYQNKPTNVIAELVSNSWDAEAKSSWIDIVAKDGSPIAIIATDDGTSMSDQEIIDNWLIIAKKKNVKRDDEKAKRKPMGRKGIGKLAPFGIGRKVDLVTYKENKINWLSLNYKDMLSQNDDELISVYPPKVIAENIASFEDQSIKDYLNSLDSSLQEKLSKRISNVKKAKQGTIIICHDLNLKRVIETENLKKSLGRRFTVTLNTPLFTVYVNDTPLTEKDCLPPFILRTPPTGMSEEYIEIPQFDRNGVPLLDDTQEQIKEKKLIKYWVGFVTSSEQTQDQSGIGVFAHGKLAQDRPFTFDSKGLEIKTRYMYGVIEADWIDEFEDDIISTDRTSIDWGYLGLPSFFDWGKTFVRQRIKEYDEFKKENIEKDLDEKIEKKLPDKTTITEGEKKHLRNLLLEVLPENDLDEEQQGKLIEATAKAWTHEPARKLIKTLWDQTSNFESNNFPELIDQLVNELVPESLSLAVVFSQRVYALTQLFRRITLGKETQLQKLLEEFPWIIGNKYEHYFANSTLKKICAEAEQKGLTPNKHFLSPNPEDKTRPDFVFLNTASENEYLIIELKGPELSIGANEIQQLTSYIMYIRQRFSGCKIQGVLVAGSFVQEALVDCPPSITSMTWNDILLNSRHTHMELLAALLAGSDANANDARVRQICELGGDSVTDFLTSMSDKNPDLSAIMKRLDTSNV
ncbi:ATP-binding protein [Acinetobacter lactucae]|uniref:ATP-binding protein n=1 Tax=Acinetobacter lactucae TaxID=1785128 RepID=UPI00148C2670|nr:ATP-binding protein [Acinetobacter lactucae]